MTKFGLGKMKATDSMVAKLKEGLKSPRKVTSDKLG